MGTAVATPVTPPPPPPPPPSGGGRIGPCWARASPGIRSRHHRLTARMRIMCLLLGANFHHIGGGIRPGGGTLPLSRDFPTGQGERGPRFDEQAGGGGGHPGRIRGAPHIPDAVVVDEPGTAVAVAEQNRYGTRGDGNVGASRALRVDFRILTRAHGGGLPVTHRRGHDEPEAERGRRTHESQADDQVLPLSPHRLPLSVVGSVHQYSPVLPGPGPGFTADDGGSRCCVSDDGAVLASVPCPPP